MITREVCWKFIFYFSIRGHSNNGGWHNVRQTLWAFWNIVFSVFGSAKFLLMARLGFERYFPHIVFNSSRQIRSKNQWSKNEKCHTGWGGGPEKCQKQCHVLFEWLLSHIYNQILCTGVSIFVRNNNKSLCGKHWRPQTFSISRSRSRPLVWEPLL